MIRVIVFRDGEVVATDVLPTMVEAIIWAKSQDGDAVEYSEVIVPE